MANSLIRHRGLDLAARSKSLVRRALAVCAVAALCHSGAAVSATFELGTASGPTTLAIGNEGLLGPFSDVFNFEIGASSPLEFDSFASTGFGNRSSIPDLHAALYSNGSLLRGGLAETVFSPEGFPSRNVSFSPLTLAAGRYQLLFSGTATSFFPDVPITSAYSGTINLTPVAAIPEPSTMALTAFGVVMMIALRRRRS
jgi:hypothetical protein